MQAELGLKGVTDGEFRRGSWHMDFLYQIGGVEKTERRLNIAFKNEAGTVEFSRRRTGSAPSSASTRRSSARISPS